MSPVRLLLLLLLLTFFFFPGRLMQWTSMETLSYEPATVTSFAMYLKGRSMWLKDKQLERLSLVFLVSELFEDLFHLSIDMAPENVRLLVEAMTGHTLALSSAEKDTSRLLQQDHNTYVRVLRFAHDALRSYYEDHNAMRAAQCLVVVLRDAGEGVLMASRVTFDMMLQHVATAVTRVRSIVFFSFFLYPLSLAPS